MSKNLKVKKSELLWGRIAAKTVYFMLGVGGGTFAAQIPHIKENLNLSPGALGFALLCCSVGGFVAMQFAASLIRRLGLRLLLAYLAPLFPLGLIAIALSNNFITLLITLALYGGLTSVVGIAVNAQAIDIEKAYARAIMSSFHALYSIGGLVGAAVGGLMAAHALSTLTSMTIVAVGLVILGTALIAKFFDETKYNFASDHTVIEKPHKHHRAKWWRNVLLIGGLIFICYLTEGSIGDWGAIYMKQAHAVSPFVAVLAYMIFNACMTTGRLTGDLMIRRIGSLPSLVLGGALGVIGLSIGLLSPDVIVALCGFGLTGLGLSVLVPTLISMVGNLPGGDRNVAITRASTCGSVGSMTGPALIGFIAEGYSLFTALLVPVALLVVLTFTSLNMHRLTQKRYQTSDALTA